MCGGIKTLKRNVLTQGRNDGGKGAQLSARRITTGGLRMTAEGAEKFQKCQYSAFAS